ncbi:general substrate transporter [Lipomyces orientalis]|uniref:General substrate transporter n=1 Tax=Lipomyces orientalis TaxID=1233043 RepID=A0ACC3TQQ4_9ASCO
MSSKVIRSLAEPHAGSPLEDVVPLLQQQDALNSPAAEGRSATGSVQRIPRHENSRINGRFSFTDSYEKGSLLVAINCVAGLAIFFFGYDQGLMSGVNNSPDYVNHMQYGYVDPDGTVHVTDSAKQGGIVAIYYFGTLLGCFLGGYLGDRLGRINSIGVGAVWAMIGTLLQSSAQNAQWMSYSRIVSGVGTGILNTVVPVWSAETAETKSRGQFIALEFTLNIFGVAAAYWLEYSLSAIGGGFSPIRWRVPVAFQAVPLFALCAIIWAFPESPRWLVMNGRNEEALYILQRLRGTDTSEAEDEYKDIVSNVQLVHQNSDKISYFRMFFGIGSGNLHIGRRVQLVVWLQILQEWIGIAGVTVYAPTMFADAGFSAGSAELLSGLNNICYMLSTLVNAFTVDRIGRRRTLFWGAIGQAITMFLAGAFSKFHEEHPSEAGYGGLAATSIFVYTSIFGATWLVVPFLYPTEIFPLEVRTRGNAFAVFGWSIGNGWLTLLCPVMFDLYGYKTLYVFAAINVLTIPIVWALYPETSQRTLEEIDLLFASNSPWVWDAEKEFERLKAGHPEVLHNAQDGPHDPPTV